MKTPYKLICKSLTRVVFLAMTLFADTVFGQSLWLKSTNLERGMFADSTAFRKGDIVTVIINEAVKSKAALSADEHKNKYYFMQNVLDHVNRRDGHRGPKITLPVPYEGKNDITLKDVAVTMQVQDVLPNGNLVLEGITRKRFHDTFQFQVIRGTARPMDIAANNTISSSKLADFTMEHLTGSSLKNARQDGIFSRLNNIINPY